MKEYAVEISKNALEELDNLYDHIAITKGSPQTAIKQYNRIKGAILALDCFPERYPIHNSPYAQKHKIRRMVIDNFSVFYMVNEAIVKVIDILYTPSEAAYNYTGDFHIHEALAPYDITNQTTKPVAIGNMTQAALDTELTKGIESMKTGVTYSADEVDEKLAKEFGI